MNYKKYIYFLIYILIASNSYGQTNVSGTISSTTWTASDGPYIVIEDILVQNGSTLTIEAGTTVKFLSEKQLQVKGMLIARGTSSSKITFTSNETNPSKGDWEYIKFFDESTDASFSGTSYTGGSIMEYCIVEYAEYGLDISDASPFINYSEIRYNGKSGSSYDHGIGIRSQSGASPRITNCDIHNNDMGVDIYYSSSNGNFISYNTIRDNSPRGGGEVDYATFSYNTIKNNTYSSSEGYDPAAGIKVSGGTVEHNIIHGNHSSSSRTVASGLYIEYPDASNNILYNNTGHSYALRFGRYWNTGNDFTDNIIADGATNFYDTQVTTLMY